MIDLRAKRLFLFDLDGVLLKGKEQPVKLGGTKVFERIRSRGKKLAVVTNNSTDAVETVFHRLRSKGIPVREEEVLTSTRLTAEYILKKYGRVSFYPGGGGGVPAGTGEGGPEEGDRRRGRRGRGGSGQEADVLQAGQGRAVGAGRSAISSPATPPGSTCTERARR